MKTIQFKSDIDVSYIQHMGSDAILAGAAWVSTEAAEALRRAEEKPEDVPGVINYLVKNRHGSPFEHGALTIYVRGPIFMFREWHRHRVGFSYNEESARYKPLDPVFYVAPLDRPVEKVENWKAGRPKFTENAGIVSAVNDNNIEVYNLAYEKYEDNLALNADPGFARDCLPVGIYSSCWVTMNPRSCMHFLSLRRHIAEAMFVSYPLFEIDKAAQALENIFAQYWPITYDAFNRNRRVCP